MPILWLRPRCTLKFCILCLKLFEVFLLSFSCIWVKRWSLVCGTITTTSTASSTTTATGCE